MKSTTFKQLSLLLLAAMFFACSGDSAKTEQTATEATTDSTATAATAEPAAAEQVQTLNAKFIEFQLGDASHYAFEDKTGKEWDFGGCDDKSLEFARELPQGEANETNQGWGSNKDLQGKWFDLKYVVRKQPLYPDGPEGDVMVITEAKMVQ